MPGKELEKIALSCILVTCVFVSYYLLVCWMFAEHEDRGIFGDSFGALTSLLTGLTFAALIYSIKQSRDMLVESQVARQEAAKQSLESAKLQSIGNLIAASQVLLGYASSAIEDARKCNNTAAELIAQGQVVQQLEYLDKLSRTLIKHLENSGENMEISDSVKEYQSKLLAEALSILARNQSLQNPPSSSSSTRAVSP